MARAYVSGKAFGGIAGKFGVKVSGTTRLLANIEKKMRNSQNALYVAMQAALLEVEAEAKRLIANGYYQPAIDTARMIQSVTNRMTKFTYTEIEGEVGTSVYYAIYVHEGTKQKYGFQGTETGGSFFNPGLGSIGWHMPPRPFLEDALKNKESLVNRLFVSAVRKGLVGI